MQINNTSAPTFGTKMEVGGYQEPKIAYQSKRFVSAIVLWGNQIAKNGVNDRVDIRLGNSKPPKSVGFEALRDYYAPENQDTLRLRWASPDNSKSDQKYIPLKDLAKKTTAQIKKFLNETLTSLQTPEVRAQVVPTTEPSAKKVLREANEFYKTDRDVDHEALKKLNIKVTENDAKARYLTSPQNYGYDDQDSYK